jgi:hypothetical protein
MAQDQTAHLEAKRRTGSPVQDSRIYVPTVACLQQPSGPDSELQTALRPCTSMKASASTRRRCSTVAVAFVCATVSSVLVVALLLAQMWGASAALQQSRGARRQWPQKLPPARKDFLPYRVLDPREPDALVLIAVGDAFQHKVL